MDIFYLDYVAVSGTSGLHRAPAWAKLLALAAMIALLLAASSLYLYAGVLLLCLVLAASARLSLPAYLGLTAYPLLFLALLLFSIDGLTWRVALGLGLRVLAISGGVLLLLFTTSYPAIFAALGRVLPGPLVAALFFTYRSLFILYSSLTNVRTALHLRGGIDWRHPLATLRNIGTALAHLLVHAIEMSQRMAESLTVRGFQQRISHLGRTP